jgi:23S rRNA (pseudouridine1915-N3)-methyltransferase
MKISVLVVGKLRGPLESSVREFEERAGRYWKLETTEVEAGVGKGDGPHPDAVRQAEGRRLLKRLGNGSESWALTREGVGMSSRSFAEMLGTKAVQGTNELIFLIGGAWGLDRVILQAADHRFSLSPLTLPHDMARLVLAEQLYRAGSILRNEPYHKGAT